MIPPPSPPCSEDTQPPAIAGGESGASFLLHDLVRPYVAAESVVYIYMDVCVAVVVDVVLSVVGCPWRPSATRAGRNLPDMLIKQSGAYFVWRV